jgi:hypothetical protein
MFAITYELGVHLFALFNVLPVLFSFASEIISIVLELSYAWVSAEEGAIASVVSAQGNVLRLVVGNARWPYRNGDDK